MQSNHINWALAGYAPYPGLQVRDDRFQSHAKLLVNAGLILRSRMLLGTTSDH